MYQKRIISSDDHVFEPPDVWTTRLDKKYRDRAPHVVREPEADWWVCEGQRLMSLGPATQTGLRFENPEKIKFTGQLENVREGSYIPAERIKDFDLDGVEIGVAYPSVGLSFYNLKDSALLTALLKTYNDWVAEFASAYPKRIKAVGLLNVDDVPSAAAELRRIKQLGLVGAMISTFPHEDRGYHLPDYEPLWAAAEETGMPLGLHFGTNRPGPGQQFDQPLKIRPSFVANVDHWVRVSIADMIFSGVFERHPGLIVGSVEQEVAWAPHFIERMDYTYKYRPRKEGRYRFKDPNVAPSDYFHRNCFISFQQDAIGVEMRQYIGVDNLLWGSDYPHIESTFPKTRQIIQETFRGCTQDEVERMVCKNALRVYHLT